MNSRKDVIKVKLVTKSGGNYSGVDIEINKNLRQKAIKSPLFNSPLFAKQLNNAFWEMWNKYI